ncbi:aminopeptidase P family protein [Tropicibacter naphthalenivorans]|uniref:Xaa-Pro dipeptidase n=1 Tax=Tropicibacter naphthalenivorans TaxID=441103 RepID=A0A0P1G2Y4_9RHOB|nr:aminopeptidase P family protein [Tropicibacter naphthalenivorans]CUH76136.1 Xaa-Pro dipeptidase [Tropicibacter naphthalenivorans]SMC39810.1 Xaa-Pro aminopeptidase [Tropicibacter naphthalenivorans]
MFQTFQDTASPDQGPARLTALRAAMAAAGVDGFLVPRADAHQGEYVAPHDDRLAWLTGFTGSAGWAVALAARAAVFVDSRYRVQVKAQVADCFEKIDWPEVALSDWIGEALAEGAIGFDPWLLTVDQLERMQTALPGLTLTRCENLIDAIWDDQPRPPQGAVFAQPLELSGEAHEDKITRLAKDLTSDAAILTLPDSIAWLLNIRGSDIPRNPVPHGFAILHGDGRVTLYMDAGKLANLGDHLGPRVTLRAPKDFLNDVHGLQGTVQIDPATCPVAVAVADALTAKITHGDDPVSLPKARKNAAELAGARAAHLRDGVAMVRFLAWLDAQPPGSLTEIDVVKALEEERRATNALRDISFETISGAGPNGAIVHYRVTEKTNRKVNDGELLLVDSGGQYVDGTTDITRTMAIGTPGDEERDAFTRVLKGMIAVSRLRFPAGLAGRDIDPFARAALWEAGLDYGHGTGHGIGSYLSVHEGPQRIARSGTVPLEPGMLLSNEPGFYKEGAYGIRIENLIAVQQAEPLPGQTVPQMLTFETLTWVPIDTRLVNVALLTQAERDWLNAYHSECEARLAPHLQEKTKLWLTQACKAI